MTSRISGRCSTRHHLLHLLEKPLPLRLPPVLLEPRLRRQSLLSHSPFHLDLHPIRNVWGVERGRKSAWTRSAGRSELRPLRYHGRRRWWNAELIVCFGLAGWANCSGKRSGEDTGISRVLPEIEYRRRDEKRLCGRSDDVYRVLSDCWLKDDNVIPVWGSNVRGPRDLVKHLAACRLTGAKSCRIGYEQLIGGFNNQK